MQSPRASVTTMEEDILMTSPFTLQSSFAKQCAPTTRSTAGLLSKILQGDNCDDWTNSMECDEEDELDSATHHHRLVRGGSGMVSHDSTNSIESTSSSSSTLEYEPELSQSFGSTKSYDLMTPIKPHIPLHGADLVFTKSNHLSSPNSPSFDSRSANEMKSQHLSQQRHNLGEMLGLKIETRSEQTPPAASTPGSATIRSNRSGAPGLAGRLKISLPSSSAFNGAHVPQTPGGHVAIGARDGAAHGAPISPFEPPTPLYATASESSFVTKTSPSSTTLSRPNMQHRHTASSIRRDSSTLNGMSPITSQFAAVSMRKASSSKGTTSETSALSDSPEALTPFSPPSLSKNLSGDLDIPSAPLERKTSASSSTSNGSSKKRTDRSAVSSRSKVAKNKAAPYPLVRDESPAKTTAAVVDGPTSDYFGTAPTPSLLRDIVKPPMAAPAMEKCVSEPVPKTVSARHLAHRTLHPTFTANYTLGDELGSGGFGFVVRATRDRDGMQVAVKFIWKDKVPSHGWVRDDEFGAIPMEAFVLKVVDSPFVVKFVDLFDDDQFFYLVMEHHGSPWKAPEAGEKKGAKVVDEGVAVNQNVQLTLPTSTVMKATMSQPNAFPLLSSTVLSPSVAVFPPESDVPVFTESPSTSPKSVKDALTAPSPRPAAMERKSSCDLFECIEQHSKLGEDKARWVFAQIVEAVYYLDKRGICHRDIKDENCVIDSDFNVKLIDFGSSVITDPRRPTPYFNRFFGTMTFASSEILQGKQYRAPHAEVWSLGVLLSILLSGECPFADPTAAIRGKISRPSSVWSSDALNLLMACLVVNPDKRATIAQIRQHPWVTKAWLQRGQIRPGDDDLFAFARPA